ncbi:Atu4866 domain-containing protein [Actinoplanes couchii]|nr:Atu4866 domain-containing protein [Actinoplanes couchii]MDR6320200.1 hypothetical protein [Actinoplanes couchii]
MKFVNAMIHGPDPGLRDLSVSDGLIAVSGGGEVIDCTGLSIVPIAGFSSLAPGSPATFTVIRIDLQKPFEYVLWRPEQAVMVVVDGRRQKTVPDTPAQPSDSPHLGMWIDTTGFLHQELTADGRYDETRNGRRHAYQGRFWIHGDRIVYLDDLGFWAYGEIRDGVLHHAGYFLEKK